LTARQQRIKGILLDGGHNTDAASALAPVINNEVAVIGMMRDKNVDGYLSLIAPKCKKIIATTPSNSRSMTADELKNIALKYCDNVVAIDNPAQAIAQNGITLICGSFYLIRDIINLI
jgi:dihydrofolate synthase/folylpolyglutamate synthase